jgi:hypothetical protein
MVPTLQEYRLHRGGKARAEIERMEEQAWNTAFPPHLTGFNQLIHTHWHYANANVQEIENDDLGEQDR